MNRFTELRWTRLSATIATVFFCATLMAQSDLSSIRGTVSDASGAIMSGVIVTILAVETGQTRSVTTDAAGNFEIPYLKVDTYKLTATKAGFETFVADNIILQSKEIRRIDIALQVGSEATHVVVTANADVIVTDEGKIDHVLQERQYKESPLAYTEMVPWYYLSTLPEFQSNMGGLSYEAAGQPSAQGEFSLNGIPNAGGGLVNTTAVSMEDMQELKATAVNNSPEFSRIANWDIVTKSGTNQFHGDVFEYESNEALNARPAFSISKIEDRDHLFGGAIGGPIKHDRTFFYFAYYGRRIPAASSFLQSVPTTPMRGGDFSSLLNQTTPTVIKDPLTGIPYPNNIIPASQLSATSLKIQQTFLPPPNYGPSGALANNFYWVFPQPSDVLSQDQFSERIDQKISDKNMLAVMFNYAWFPYDLAGNYPGLDWTRHRHHQFLTVSDTHTFSGRLLNEFRYGFAREHFQDGLGNPVIGSGANGIALFGLQGISNPPPGPGLPTMNITGYQPITVTHGYIDEKYMPMTWSDSVTHSAGRHIIKLGGEFRRYFYYESRPNAGAFGTYTFDGSLTGNAYADFLLGLPHTSVRLTPILNRHLYSNEVGLFAMDTFKVSRRLTLTYGLRWEAFGPARWADNRMYNWDPKTGDVIVPPNLVSTISPNYSSTITVVGGQVTHNTYLRNFVPRVAAAYRLNDKTVIRGGWGLFDEYFGYNAFVTSGGPFTSQDTFTNQIVNGVPLFQFPNPFPPSGAKLPSQSVTGYPLITPNGKTMQYNVTVERQIGRFNGLRLSYIGSRDYGLDYMLNINKPPASTVPFTSSRNIFPQFVSTSYYYFNGESRYDGLQAEFKRQLSKGLMFVGTFMWVDNRNNISNLQDPYNPLQWARDAYTPERKFLAQATYNLPFGRGQKLFSGASKGLDNVIGGWELDWIGTFQTGEWFTPTFSGSDPSDTNTFGGVPDRIADGNLPSSQRSASHWFNPSAFVAPPTGLGRYGNSGVNILEGPGLTNIDLSLVKRFSLSERFKMEYVCAVSDLFNHLNLALPNANISVPAQVGTITQGYGAYEGGAERGYYRQMEMRLRLMF